ncbi:MAG: BACON domain-containing protein [Rikenellaceae bacterium]
MKSKLLTCFTMLCAFMMVGCGDYYSVDVAPAALDMNAVLVLSPESDITLPATDATATIQVTTNVDAEYFSFAVSSAAESWCSAAYEDGTITITLVDNASYVARAGILTVKAYTEKQTINITQEAKVYVAAPDYAIEGAYKVALPELSAFENSKIYLVRDDSDVKVAEICLEYLGVDDGRRAVVVYPAAGAAADYDKGVLAYYIDETDFSADDSYTTCGGILAIDYTMNTYTYFDGEMGPLTEFYITETGISATEPEADEEDEDWAIVEHTAEPYYVTDQEDNIYPVVKIGRDVWLGANLRATSLSDGTEIPVVSMSDSSSNTGSAAANYAGDDSDGFEEYGLLYNANTLILSCAELVAVIDDDCLWKMSEGSYSSSTAAVQGYDYEWSRLFMYVGEYGLGDLLATGYEGWANGSSGDFDGVCTNLTGLAIPPAGQNYSNGTTWNYESQAFFFQGELGYGYNFAELDGRATDFAGMRSWSHAADWCSIRLVRADVRE